MTDAEIDALLAAALAGPAGAGVPSLPEGLADRIVAAAEFHGIAALLHHRLSPDAPARLREVLRARAYGEAVRTLGERRALCRLLPVLVAAGARPLIFKGTALAYSLYSDPALRPRADTDILIDPEGRSGAEDALRRLGWQRQRGLGRGEAGYARAGIGGAEHIDLHWRISNSPLLSRRFTHDELWRRRQALPALHGEARGACPVDALLIACMHRLKHADFFASAGRFGSDRLIWLHDIRLIASVLSDQDWGEVARRAGAKGLAGACEAGLRRARDRLAAPCPAWVLEALADAGKGEADAYLRADSRRRDWMDFLALPGIAAKARFAIAVGVPSVEYMREWGSATGPRWLPWLYASRAVGGVARRLRRSPSAPDRP